MAPQKHALVVNRDRELVEMYAALLEERGYAVEGTTRLKELEARVAGLLERCVSDAAVIADCAREYVDHRCVCEAFRGQDLSRLRILLTTERPPSECPLAGKTGIPHYVASDIRAIAGWIARLPSGPNENV